MMNAGARALIVVVMISLTLPVNALPERGICAPTYFPGAGVLFTESVASDLKKLGCGYLRVPFYDEHGSVNLAAFDEVLARAEAHGIGVIGVVLLDPADWDRESPQFFTAFIDRCDLLAARYADRVDAWELWNEPEQAVGYISPTTFGQIAASACDTIKAHDPSSVVMPGGISRTHPYIEEFYDSPAVVSYKAGHGHYPFDAIAVHPYDWCCDPRFYLADYISGVRAVMTAHGDGTKPIWITEVGWNTAQDQPDSVGNDASQYQWNDFAQARNVTGLYQTSDSIPGIAAVFYYALYDYALPDSLGWFGLRRYDSTPKPAWFAYQTAACGGVVTDQLINGGFESSDTSAWTVYGVVDGAQGGPWFAGIVPRSGNRFLGSAINMAGPGGGKNGGVFQTIAVESRCDYHLSAYVWTYQEGGAEPDAACRVGIDPSGGSEPASTSIVWSDFHSSGGGWSLVDVECTAQNASVTVFVEFKQDAPTWDVTAVDDILLRKVTNGKPFSVKKLPDGAPVSVDGIVTAVDAGQSWFYVESADRTSGIRVISDSTVSQGDAVTVSGYLATDGSERAIVAQNVTKMGTGIVTPLILNGRYIAGGDLIGVGGGWAAQSGTIGSVGVNNVGLLVRFTGTVTCVAPSQEVLYVDDGSARWDGAYSCSGIRVLSRAAVSVGDAVTVTGVVSCFENAGGDVCPSVIADAVEPVIR